MPYDDYEDIRYNLAPYVGSRVKLVGYYESQNLLFNNRTALVQDCEFWPPGQEDDPPIPVGHLWVQHASEITASRPLRGSRIEFWARVQTYTKKRTTPNAQGLMQDICHGVGHPCDVEILEGGTEPKPAPLVYTPTPPPPAVNPLEMLKAAKELATKIGPQNAAAVAPHLSELVRLSDKCGGPDKLAELFAIFA